MREIFARAAEEHDLVLGTFRVVRKADITIRHTREDRRVHYLLSDYFDEMPDELLQVLAENTFAKMEGKISSVYTPELKSYLERDIFSEITQTRYLRRQRSIRSARGLHQDLNASFDRVVGTGLVRPPPGVHVAWSAERLSRCWGYYISYPRVLVINSALDTAGPTTDALDSVMFHELLHAEECFAGRSEKHSSQFRARAEMFPRSLRAAMELQSLNFKLRWKAEPRLGERITDYC